MKPVLFLGALFFVASIAHAQSSADVATSDSVSSKAELEQMISNTDFNQDANEIRAGFGGRPGGFHGPVGRPGGFGGPRGPIGYPRPGFPGGYYPHPGGGYYPRPGFPGGYYPNPGYPGYYPIPVPIPVPGPIYAGAQITCLSVPGSINACGVGFPISYATIVRQLSPQACVDGYSFGLSPDRLSVWVANGCQAVFVIN